MTLNPKQCAIGVDLGGQGIKLAVVDSRGNRLLHRQQAIDAGRPASELTRLVVNQIRQLRTDARAEGMKPQAVGLVMPGYMDRSRTRLIYARNLPTLSGSSILADIRAAVDLPLTVDADSNAAAWGEFRFGGGRGTGRLIAAAIGTGIGAGVIIDGRLVRLRNHVAGSLGHVIINARGDRGRSAEELASGRAIERLALEKAHQIPTSLLGSYVTPDGRLSGEHIAEALRANDAAAMEVVTECGWWLGAAVATWSVIFAPDKVLIGGGMSGLGDVYFSAIRQGFSDTGNRELTGEVSIEPATLGAHAGVIGAAALALDHVR